MLVLALTSFLGWFLSCHCYGPADWFSFKSMCLRHKTLLSRIKNRALKIFFKPGSLPGHLHHLQHRLQIGILADNAVCNGTLLSPPVWTRDTSYFVSMPLNPSSCGSAWQRRVVRQGAWVLTVYDMGRLCPQYTTWGHLSGTWQEKKITHPQFRFRSKTGLKPCKLLRGDDNPDIMLAVQVLERFCQRSVACSLH